MPTAPTADFRELNIKVETTSQFCVSELNADDFDSDLTSIDLSGNQFESVPRQLRRMESLEEINLSGNPIKYIDGLVVYSIKLLIFLSVRIQKQILLKSQKSPVRRLRQHGLCGRSRILRAQQTRQCLIPQFGPVLHFRRRILRVQSAQVG